MKLLWAIIRWLFSQITLLLLISCLVVLSFIAKDWWNQRKVQEAQLQNLQQQLFDLNTEIRAQRSELSLEKRYLHLRNNEPSRWTSPLQWFRWQKEMETVGVLIDRKNAELLKLKQQKQQLLLQIQRSEHSLYRTQQVFFETLRKSAGAILLLAALVMVGPIVWKAFWYFGVANLAKRAVPIQLNQTATNSKSEVGPAHKNHAVLIQPGEPFVSKMDWLHQYTAEGKKKTRFLLDWHSPFISYASGLAELTEIVVEPNSKSVEVVLSSGNNPDAYLCEIKLENHPGVVIRPSQIVALSGNLKLKTRWTLGSPHAWLSGRLRHIVLAGTGRAFVEGKGGLTEIELREEAVRISESVVAAFDGNLEFSTVRTETFWPYYRQRVPLYDYEFKGEGLLLRQTSPDSARINNPVVRFVDALFNAFGKLLGL